MDSIEDDILKLENDLLKSEVRKSSQKINEIVASDFIEFTSSGCEYHYKNGDIFQDKDNNELLKWEILDFQTKKIGDNCILAMYKLIKYDEQDENKKYSLRSSIWKALDKKWKMIFHQGTPAAKFEIENKLR